MPIVDMIFAAIVVGLGAVGTYLLLPHRHGAVRPRSAHGGGAIAAALGLLVFLGYFWSPPGPLLPTLFLYIFGATAIVGALLTVTSRNPVHSALWFASVVLSTAGLFLLADAPFLAAGTIIVYAGAIIVTFLFVIMLAQMEGKADYDRAARTPGWATATTFVILWCLIFSLSTIRTTPPSEKNKGAHDTARNRLMPEEKLIRSRDLDTYVGVLDSPIVAVVDQALSPISQTSDPAGGAVDPNAIVTEEHAGRIARPNVAGLGASLYTDHLVSVAIAGALLFVALVGAVAITSPKRPIRPGNDPAQVAAVGTIRP